MAADNIITADKSNNKLLDGPCSSSYIDLELCAAEKDVKTHRVRPFCIWVVSISTVAYYDINYYLAYFFPFSYCIIIKEKIVRCPRETDSLIKCMKRHPMFFQE